MTPDDGAVAVEFAAGLALLVIPVAVVVLSLPNWLGATQVARDAARQGARLAVLDVTIDSSGVEGFVRDRLADGGVAIRGVAVERSPEAAAVDITVRLPVLQLPWVGEVGGFDRRVTHVELYDTYGTRLDE